MGKITVKHYLNTNLKPYLIGQEKYYQVYFLLRFQNKNTKIKSLLSQELNEKEWDEIQRDENNLTNQKLKKEVSFIESVVRKIENGNFIFDFKVFSDFWYFAKYPIVEKFQDFIDWSFNYRFNKNLDIYQQLNFEIYEEVLKLIKHFVVDSPLCFRDELFLIQLFDEQTIGALDLYLNQNKFINIWEIKDSDLRNFKMGDAIKVEYIQKEFKTIDFLIENLIKERVFQIEYNKCTSGCTGNEIEYFNKIIKSLSGG